MDKSTLPLHTRVHTPIGLIMDPPYADNVVLVCSIGGLFFSFLYIFIGRTLASAPVSSLKVIFPPSVCTVESQGSL